MKKNLTLLIALFLLQGGFLLNAQVLQADSLALVDFYNAAGGPNWTDKGTWLTGAVPTWAGVTVTGDRVTKLTVAENNMVGTISPSVGNLTELTELRLNGNETNRTYIDIHGSVPVEFYDLTKLTLVQLKFTNLTGWTQRDSIYKLKALIELNTQATKFGGQLPDSLFTLPNIQKLYLHDGNYTGAVPQTMVKAIKLIRFYVFGGSKLTNLPYVNLSTSAKLELTGNYFTFAQVKPYADTHASTPYAGYTNLYQYVGDTTTITVNENASHLFSLTVPDGETYNWFKDANTTPVAINTNQFSIKSVDIDSAGTYVCKVQSSLVASFDVRAVYVLKVTPAAGIANRGNASFSVHPNPFTDKLQINAAAKIDAVSIYNITGKVVMEQKNLSGTSLTLPVSDLKPGVYMVRIKMGNTLSVQKLIKK